MELLEGILKKHPRMAARARNGSTMAAIRLKCLDCVCDSPSEVTRCHITACPLWPYRFGMSPARAAKKGHSVSVSRS